MKKLLYLLSIFLIVGCSLGQNFNSYDDDIYYDPNDTKVTKVTIEKNYVINYYDYNDYHYASRIRRFHRPYNHDYYGLYYTDYYWYTYDLWDWNFVFIGFYYHPFYHHYYYDYYAFDRYYYEHYYPYYRYRNNWNYYADDDTYKYNQNYGHRNRAITNGKIDVPKVRSTVTKTPYTKINTDKPKVRSTSYTKPRSTRSYSKPTRSYIPTYNKPRTSTSKPVYNRSNYNKPVYNRSSTTRSFSTKPITKPTTRTVSPSRSPSRSPSKSFSSPKKKR